MPVDSMNKVIHAAVRRDLQRLETALDSVSDGDRARARGLQRAWQHLDRQLQHHHQQEDTLLFPVVVHLVGHRSLVEAMEAEHQAMSRALADIDRAVSSYAASASAVDAADAADVVRRGREVVEEHLAHEEADLEPLMQGFTDAPEWQQAIKRVRKVSPRSAGWLFAWLQDGAGEEEQAFLATALPTPVRLVFTWGFGRGYHRTIAPVWS